MIALIVVRIQAAVQGLNKTGVSGGTCLPSIVKSSERKQRKESERQVFM